MPTRNVVLSDHQHDLVETLVKSGRYQNASEVLREGLRMVEERERLQATKIKALKQSARRGWEDIASGHFAVVADKDLDDFIGQIGLRAAQRDKTAA